MTVFCGVWGHALAQSGARYSLGTQRASFRGLLAPPAPSLCLPEELTEFEAGRGGRGSHGLDIPRSRAEAPLPFPLVAISAGSFWQMPMPALLRLSPLPFHQSERSAQLLCDGRDTPERVHHVA